MNTKRPVTISAMQAALQRLGTEESHKRGLAFKPKPTDVIISPYAKSGTTWLQQMVHALRSRGDMDFREITQVVPWLEMALDLGIDIEGPQKWQPRAYKSHLTWREVPKGGKYIYSIRNPKDVVVSFYHFFEGWFFEPGTINISEFCSSFFMERELERNYWTHIASWWQQRENPDVLLLCFEDMKADLPTTITAVAKFIGVELDDALFEITLKYSSYEFMKLHEDQFNDSGMRELSEKLCGIPPGGDASKVRAGQTNAHKQELPQEISDLLDEQWRATIGHQFGLQTYGNMRAELRK